MPNPTFARSNSLTQTNFAKEIENLKDAEISPHWIRKMKTAFNMFDTEKKGVLNRGTFEAKLDKLVKINKLNGEEEGTHRQLMEDIMHDVMQHQPNMNFEMFYKTNYIIMTNPLMKETYENMILQQSKNIFDAIDTNHDGIISLAEWRVYFLGMGIEDQEEADACFKEIDLNKDGSMSREEFNIAHKDYLENMEPSKYDLMLGRLAEV